MYKILLCLRYLRTRYIALACIISVMLGVATMIVVNSVMAGFSTEMRDRIHGLLADVIIETHSLDGASDADGLMHRIRHAVGDDIAGMTATVEVYGMLTFQFHGQYVTRPVTLIGITPEGKAKVGPLQDYLDSYKDIKEDGEVVRPALRSRETPPGWELTASAMEYRRAWVARQQFMLSSFPEPPKSNPDRDAPPSFDPSQFNSTGAPPFAVESSNDATPFFEAPAVAAKPDDPQDGPRFVDNENPFLNVPQIAPEQTPTVDPAAPLDGRLYVGEGLISYPVDDKGTGKVRIVKMVEPGDDVKISTVTAGRPPEAAHFNATIVDVFKSSMSEYDANLVFCNIEYLQKIRGMLTPGTNEGNITSIQIKLNDFNKSDEIVQKLKSIFPPGQFQVRTWEQKQGPLLAAVEVESAILNVLLFLIIAVAGFGILAIFYMIVVEKTRDIGIMKALGASSQGVMSIFLSYGLALGIVGSGVGVTLGLLFVNYINEIEECITMLTGRKVFDEKIYYFPEIPTSVNPMMVVWVAVGAMAIAVLASVMPARRASQLHPVEALRYE